MALSEMIKTVETFYNDHYISININLFSSVVFFILGVIAGWLFLIPQRIFNLFRRKKEPETTLPDSTKDTIGDIGGIIDKISTEKPGTPISFIINPITNHNTYLQQPTNDANLKKEDDK